MNKHVHRLVFDRRRGMRVPAHEHARSAGKAAGGQTRAVALVSALSLLAATEGAVAQMRADGAVDSTAVTRPQGAVSVVPAARPVSELVRSALELTQANLPKYTADGKWALNTGSYTDPKFSDDGKILTLTQKGTTIVLNWDSFDIANGYTVRFVQPDGGRALNRVHNLTPSVINGVLTATGEVMLENTAGVIFGNNARVDTRSMVATALKVSDAAFEAGIRSYRKGQASFGGDNTAVNGFVAVERGAQIRSLPGGDVILVAPRVVNQGLIETPQGQAILAAGKTVYLYAPLDLAQRGLLVAIDNFDEAALATAPDLGSVENARVSSDTNSGTIRADKGTINLVGAAIRQKGTLTATTAVKGQNGAIFLTAMKDTVTRTPENDKGALVRVANNTGTVELGGGSVTEVLPSVDGLLLSQAQVNEGKIGVSPDEVMRVRDKPVAPKTLASTATDAEKAQFAADKAAYEADLKVYEALLQQASDTFYRSRIDIIGKEITLRAGSAVQAPAGEVNILATSNWATSPLNNSQSALGKDDSRIVMEAGAKVDVSGLNNLLLPASRNQLQGRLFSIELADSPLQRDGVIYRADLLADARRRITIGDVTGLYNDIRYSAAEYSTAGGMLRMQAQGAMLLDAGASIDFSGGKVTYDAGTLVSSLLLRNGAVARLEDASKDLRYSELISDPSSATEDELARLGLADPGVTAPNVLESQTVGMSAGVALMSAPVMSLGATLNGGVTMSDVQRLSTDVAERDKAFNTSITLGAVTDFSRVVNRSAALTTQPHLYASLKPTAGLLVLGQHHGTVSNGVEERTVQSSIQVTTSGLSLPTLASAWTTESWQQTLAQVGTDLKVSAALINAAGLAGLTLQADKVSIGSAVQGDLPALSLASGGSFEANAFSGVQVDGRIASAGGAISLLARKEGADVVLGSTASLDAAGTVRDERVSAAPANEGVARKGGTVTLQAARSVLAATGSDIDVSGAAWRSSGGAYVQGTAGELSIAVNQQYLDKTSAPAGTLSLGSTLSAYDFSAGGTFTLKGIPALVIGGTRKGAFAIGNQLFADRGFGKLDVTTIGHIDIASGALVQPTLVNMVPTAARLAGLTAQPYELTVLEAGRRQPFRLTLKAEALPGTTAADTTSGLPNGANLTVGQGALIDVGIGGAIDLSAGGSIEMDGTLRALAGNVSLKLLGTRGASATDTSAFEAQGYLKGQRIHLDNDALIDVSGVVKSYLIDGGLAAFLGLGQREVGEVLSGGTVTLGGSDGTATRGQLIMDKDATIRLNGVSGLLDRSALPGKSLISAGAGTLNIMSTDGFQLLGKVEAAAPNASVSGGTINIALSQEGLVDRTDPALVAEDGVEFKKYPEGQRSIRITGSQAQAVTLAESGLGFGEGVVSAELLNTSGFDRIQLRADQSVQLNAGANLVAADNRTRLQSVVLNASVIDVADGAGHTIQAHQVSMGPKGKPGDALPVALPQVTAASKRAAAGDLGGTGSLEVQAGLIEVVGDTAVLGTDKLTLNATLAPAAAASLGRTNGEIRFVGQSSASNAALTGQLSFSGELNLVAGQVYATTLSKFNVKGYDTAGADMKGTLNILTPSAGISSSQTPLSALAALNLRANSITLDGTVRQPFGSIDVEANTLTLTGRADLSVSGDGTKVPVGTTLNQTQWVYGTQGTVTTTGTAANIAPKDNATAIDLSQLPLNKQITLNGKTQLKIDSQSAVDVRAGGDIVASEFKQGVGGTTDTYLRKNVFAVLPNYSYDFAPTDADIGATAQKVGSTLRAGDQITIATDNGVLKAGTYTLMDARYGILPGAVLVSATTLPVTAPLPVAVQNDDGSVIVSGHRKATGTAQSGGGDQRLALTLEPEATFRKKSEVILTSGNAYQQQQSVRSGNTLFNPGDAGRVSLLSEKAFDWAARFNFSGKAQEGLSAGQFDLSMLNMVVQADPSQAGPTGAKSVSLDQLNALGADSVLLGGKRTTQADGSIKVERNANSITFQADLDANGAPVVGTAEAPRNVLSTGGELMAVATRELTVENGLTIVSTGADTGASRRYEIQNAGAALQVGNLANTDISVVFSDGALTETAQGNLTAGKDDKAGNVKLQGNSVQLDATHVLSVAQSTELITRSLSLGGQRVAVGASGEDELDDATLSVSDKLLTAANNADRLKLRSYTSIDFYRSVELGSDQMTRLSLDAPQLLGRGTAADTAVVRAREVVLANSSGRKAPTQQVTENGNFVTKAELGASALLVSAKPVLRDGKTGGLTIAASLTAQQSAEAQAGQRLAFGKGTLQSAGDIIFSGRGQTVAQGDLTLRAARVTADSTSDQTVEATGALNIEKAPGGKTLNESLGAGGKVALAGATVTQAGLIDIEAGRVSMMGAGVTGQTDTVVFAEGSETRVDGRTLKVSDTHAVASGGGQITAQARTGRMVIDGALSAAAAAIPEGMTGDAPYAGTVTLKAADAVVMGEKAAINLEASSGKGGNLNVDAGKLLLGDSAQAAALANARVAQSGLDKLMDISRNASGNAHRAVDVRVRADDLSLNTSVKAAMVALTSDSGKVTLGGQSKIDATALQGGVVQLQAKGDLTLQTGAQVLAQSTRAGANGGDILLSSTSGQVLLGKATVKADSEGDTADGRIVIRAGQTQDAAGNYTGDVNVGLLPAGAADAVDDKLTLQAGQIEIEAVRVYKDAADTAVNAQHTSLIAGVSSGQAWGLTTLVEDAAKFATDTNKAKVLNNLGLSNRPEVHVKAGVEVQTLGNLTVDNGTTEITLNTVRAGTEPITLTIRSAGDINVNSTVSDGFTAASGILSTAAGDATSMRFVAGADTSSAKLSATQADATKGHFTLAGGKFIRTTAGSIDVNASGDVRLMAPTLATSSAIYVAGRTSALASNERVTSNPSANARFTERGGRLTVAAGGNVGSYFLDSDNANALTQQQVAQMTGNYFFHGGTTAIPVAWWTGFNAFRQGFGSFGGGNISVTAGNAVSNVAVVAPTSARTVQVVDAAGKVLRTELKELNGGNIEVLAGGDIDGGVYFLGRGQGRIAAGGSLNRGADQVSDKLVDGVVPRPDGTVVYEPGAMLGLMAGTWDVSALKDLNVSYIFNPTVLPFRTNGQSPYNTGNITNAASGLNANNASVYFTYAADAGVTLTSVQGSVNWETNAQALNLMHRNADATSAAAGIGLTPTGAAASTLGSLASVAPPVVSINSLQGNVLINTAGRALAEENGTIPSTNGIAVQPIYVMPTAKSDVNIYAAQDLVLQGNLQLLDAQQAQLGLPSMTKPALVAGNTTTLTSNNIAALNNNLQPGSSTTVTSANGLRVSSDLDVLSATTISDLGQAANAKVVHVYAGRDIVFDTKTDDGLVVDPFLRSNRPMELVAGRDMVNPAVIGQNFTEDDVTRIAAGRDITGGTTTSSQILLGGPGALRVEAGRDINLNQSLGVVAVGNEINTALPEQSAKITLSAGNARTVNLSQLLAQHGADPALRLAMNAALEASKLPVPGGADSWAALGFEAALSAFSGLTDGHQVAAVSQYLNAVFVARYLPDQAGRSDAYYRSDAFLRLKQEAMWKEAISLAGQAVAIAVSSNAAEEATRAAQRKALFAQAAGVVDLAGLGASFNRSGDINLSNAKVHNLGLGGGTQLGQVDNSLGGIDLVAAGQVTAGLPSADARKPGGFINFQGGSFRSLTGGDFLAEDQKVIVVGRGNLYIYTLDGSIDSGKGSNTSAAKPLPVRVFDATTGRVITQGQPPTSGSGFQAVGAPSDVETVIGLYAPNGEIRALDAFIKGSKVEIAAPKVVGADNIANATGTTAPPPPVVSLSLTPKVADTAAGVAQAIDAGDARGRDKASSSMLTVELLGFGDGNATAAGAAEPPKEKDKDKEKR